MSRHRRRSELGKRRRNAINLPQDDGESRPDEPAPAPAEPSDSSDLDDEDIPCTDEGDDPRWDVFIPDDDECDPEPDPGDFWTDGISDFGFRIAD